MVYCLLRCSGNEATLADCVDKALAYNSDYYRRQDAGVDCSLPQSCARSTEEAVKMEIISMS